MSQSHWKSSNKLKQLDLQWPLAEKTCSAIFELYKIHHWKLQKINGNLPYASMVRSPAAKFSSQQLDHQWQLAEKTYSAIFESYTIHQSNKNWKSTLWLLDRQHGLVPNGQVFLITTGPPVTTGIKEHLLPSLSFIKFIKATKLEIYLVTLVIKFIIESNRNLNSTLLQLDRQHGSVPSGQVFPALWPRSCL